jgi:acylphosphatase
MRVRVWVSGHVQGVGYRAYVAGQAAARSVAGAATNLPDGRVLVVAEGPAAGVRSLVAALSGPDAPGRVTAVQEQPEPPQGITGFTTG